MSGKNITNKLTKVVCIMLATFVFQHAKADDATEMKLSNCNSRVVTYLPVSETDKAGSALYYPESTMSMFSGCQITSIRVGLGGKTDENAVRIFITRDMSGQPEYEQYCTASRRGWNTFTLDTPYTLDGSPIYIGYEQNGATYLSYCSALFSGEEWVWRRAEGWVKYDDTYSAALEAVVQGDNLPKHNVRLSGLVMPGYALTGSGIAYTGSFINLGAADVQNLTLTYKADGQEVASETVSVDPVAYRSAGEFTASGLTLTAEGEPELSVEITAVNGNADLDPTDNASRQKKTICRSSFTPRKTLMEVFSTESCTNCPTAHEDIETVLGDKENIIEVGHHAGFYTDKLTVNESVEYEYFYETGRLYAPAVMFDRTNVSDNFPSLYTYDSPLVAPDKNNLPVLYSEADAAPAFADVKITKQLDEATRRLSLTVEGRQLLPVDDPESLRLFVWLKEDSIYTTSQRGASAGFWHRHALRSSLTPTWGEKADIAGGFTATYETTIDDAFNINQMYAVAFIGNYDSQNRNNCRVLNADEVKLTDRYGTLGISAAVGDADLRVSLSGGSIVTGGSAKQVSVYDMSGRCVMRRAVNGDAITPLHSLTKGAYIVKVSGKKQSKSLKFVK